MSDIDNFDIRTHVLDLIIETFDTMASMEIEVSDSKPQDTGGVSRMVAAVNFAGNVIGVINIQISADLSRLMMANLIDLEPEEIEEDAEIRDLLAEISKIIGGSLESDLNDIGHPCVISPPSLIYGADFSIKFSGMDRFECYVFTYQEELIIVEVSLKTQPVAENRNDFSFFEVPGKLDPANIEKIDALDPKARVSEAIITVFDTMFSTQLEPMDTIPSEYPEDLRNVGSVSYAGEANGMVSIHVSDRFSRELTAAMCGLEVETLEGDEKIQEMLGEIGNAVGGNLKSTFNDAGLACVLSTPLFITGTDFKIESLDLEKYERFAFQSDDNIVIVEMGVRLTEWVQAAGQPGQYSHYALGDESPEYDINQKEASAPQTVNEVRETVAVESPAQEVPQSEPPTQPAADQTAKLPQPPPAASPVQETSPPSPENEAPKGPEDFDLDLLLDIPLEIKVELGRTKIQIQELLNLSPGSAVKLTRLEGEPVDILANDTLIARGEVVVQNEKYGIRVTEITSRIDRIKSFGK
jgi:flagellar motor switch protein FliN